MPLNSVTLKTKFMLAGIAICLVLVTLGWSLQSATPAHAAAQVAPFQQGVTATPAPTQFSAEVIREGRPVGIILGTIIILMIIGIGTLPTLLKNNQSHLKAK